MVLAIGLLVTFLGRSPRFPSAVVGGVGFGFFIDELGKFISSDNNYFFEPAAALIYLIFIGLFLLTRSLQRRRGLSPTEKLSNAIDLVGRRRAGTSTSTRSVARSSSSRVPIRASARGARAAADQRPGGDPGLLAVARRRARHVGARLPRADRKGLVPIGDRLGVRALGGAVVDRRVRAVFSVGVDIGDARRHFGDAFGDLSFINIASLCTSAVSAVLVFLGVRDWREGKRLDAYRYFDARCSSRSSSRACSRSWSRSSGRPSGSPWTCCCWRPSATPRSRRSGSSARRRRRRPRPRRNMRLQLYN